MRCPAGFPMNSVGVLSSSVERRGLREKTFPCSLDGASARDYAFTHFFWDEASVSGLAMR